MQVIANPDFIYAPRFAGQVLEWLRGQAQVSFCRLESVLQG